MVNLRIPASAISTDALLEFGTCPLHDAPGVRTRKRIFYTATPLWTVLIVIFSLLIGLIVMLALRKQVDGKIAECQQCIAGQQRFRYTVISSWVLVLGLIFALAAGSNGAVFLLWFVVLIAALIYSFTGNRMRITGVLSKDRNWVELKKIAPTFAAKVQNRMVASSG